ncbi:methylmalonyl-CoA mutase family protein [Lunatibacter salilacus]|uniref:methylmalonyl-CoA mutase family protein n=1 Tax=Lunatibacter salilacus TaxID=2483804 RepID=UPI00131E4A04|nr:methylmalonyl-CoA mutase family protein [Lunatibacter salilacus]
MQHPYSLKNPIRIVTATSLFDGHDVSINIMRRLIQAAGVEVIHLGHNRSVHEIVNCAIQEDVQAIACTSYQGGHMEFFTYMYDLLRENNAGHIRIFGGGGGTILQEEMDQLHAYGITRIYSPDDGRAMGLEGMIADLVQKSDFSLKGNTRTGDENFELTKEFLPRLITLAENAPEVLAPIISQLREKDIHHKIPVVGITGTGGAGKSSLVDELVRRFLMANVDKQVAILSIDPTKRKSGGALLGDRIRMNAIDDARVYMRSMATRQSNLALSKHISEVLTVMKAVKFDLILLETSGIGQSDSEVVEFADVSVYVMTPEYGAPTQLEKIDMLDFADLIVLNKADKKGAEDALRDVKKQYRRNHLAWDLPEGELPVFSSMASQFNDPGMNRIYNSLMKMLSHRSGIQFSGLNTGGEEFKQPTYIIPSSRVRYLSEITEANREYDNWVIRQKEIAQQLFGISKALEVMDMENADEVHPSRMMLEGLREKLENRMDPRSLEWLQNWPQKSQKYKEEYFSFTVRDREIKVKTSSESLSSTRIPRVALPSYEAWGDLLKWGLRENFPGEFPYTAGVFPFKREGEEPTRMFAGEGGPERTNRRFHYLSRGLPAKRLSTAFDSVTLYGEDPDFRPDIFGKIGNSGVSICTLDDAKKLYSGFDLADAMTSVSMTINGPSSIITAYFLHAAIDQQCEKYISANGMEGEIKEKIKEYYQKLSTEVPTYAAALPEGHDGLGLMLLGVSGAWILPQDVYQKIKSDTLSRVRGTVQSDIFKEDQAQNTCIFSTEFSLRLMGDMQQYFIEHRVRNFYSVSISGYHIAEAGANPITQLALTLSNGFTYVEYYLSRGMNIDDFAPNLSFFFSNGLDPEYAVIGRVARRIWAKAMRLKYGANERSQMLKYHIQTSGRSLHAQEIDFNDIRTTLQALYAVFDNCNSLHTNAYDEAITTPTEASVRRAIAIQLIINKELGLAKNENPLQGSFIIEELTDLVEEAVYLEFDRINDRGGVLGAMETMYQRGKIQEESMRYETLKHSGEYPIIGVNTFLSRAGSPTVTPGEIIRATNVEKENQIQNVLSQKRAFAGESKNHVGQVQQASTSGQNIFHQLMEAAAYCSLGELTHGLYAVGGQYRRNM